MEPLLNHEEEMLFEPLLRCRTLKILGLPLSQKRGLLKSGAHPKRAVSFKLLPFYVHLTLAHGAWIWGELPPTQQSSDEEDQPNRVGEVKGTHEPVSQSTPTDGHSLQSGDPNDAASVWREQSEVIAAIRERIMRVYSAEDRVSKMIDEIIEDLEDAEVQEIV